MLNQLIQLAVLVVMGVIFANMIHNAKGTSAFFNGLGGLWGDAINGLLGKSNNS